MEAIDPATNGSPRSLRQRRSGWATAELASLWATNEQVAGQPAARRVYFYRMRNGLGFLKAFVAQPTAIGAIWPSSPALAHAMVAEIDWARVGAVLEYGPGTGAFTGSILAAMKPGTRFVAIEQSADLAGVMEERFPRVTTVNDSVENVRDVCNRHGIDQVQAIICGLPWAAFPEDTQDRLLGAMMTVLAPGGQFATFAYLQGLLVPAGRRFRRKLPDFFSTVHRSHTVYRNLPPAFVYRCRR